MIDPSTPSDTKIACSDKVVRIDQPQLKRQALKLLGPDECDVSGNFIKEVAALTLNTEGRLAAYLQASKQEPTILFISVKQATKGGLPLASPSLVPVSRFGKVEQRAALTRAWTAAGSANTLLVELGCNGVGMFFCIVPMAVSTSTGQVNLEASAITEIS